MGENTKIEWAHHTFNPWIGCAKVHAGCANCYAEEQMDHRWGKARWGPNGTRVRTSESNWKTPLKWNREAKELGIRYRVFCASLADIFEDRSELVAWRHDLLELIDRTPHLDWLVLTKRAANIPRMIDRYRPNVWLGTSISDQATADKQVPELLKCRDLTPVLFLSAEPLLGLIDLRKSIVYQAEYYCGVCAKWYDTPAAKVHCPNCGCEHDREECSECGESDYELICPECLRDGGNGGLSIADVCQRGIEAQHGLGVDWVIAGGESGPDARPCHPQWARSLRDQCVLAEVPFFWKQWGEWLPVGQGAPPSDWTDETKYQSQLVADVHCLRVGKKTAGRMLDGREWSEFPSTGGIDAQNASDRRATGIGQRHGDQG